VSVSTYATNGIRQIRRPPGWKSARAAASRRSHDYEHDPAVSEALIRWAAINTMIRRLDRGRPATRQRRRLLTAPE
jgi:hypothetical protein